MLQSIGKKSLLILLLIASTNAISDSKPRLGVFLTTLTRALNIKKALKADSAFKGLAIDVFSRFRDLERANKTSPFDWLFVPHPVATGLEICKIMFQVQNAGSGTFNYYILTLEENWNKVKMPQGSIGVVDMLGSARMKRFVQATLAKDQNFKKIRMVSKSSNLFPLLAIGNVKFIFVNPNDYDKQAKLFTTPTKIIGKSKKVQNPVICKQGSANLNSPNFLNTSGQTLTGIGFKMGSSFSKITN